MESFASPVFDRLPEPKQRAVLTAAAAEFASRGFTAAKVDEIAARAGISVGSLYQYFGTKEACFRCVLEDGLAELRTRLEEVSAQVSDPWERIEALVRLIPGHSRRHAETLRLYHEVAGDGMAAAAGDFCERFEGLSAEVYRTLLAEAQTVGLVRADLDPAYGALFLDNLFVSLQFAYSGGYHGRRQAVYLRGPGDDEEMVRQALAFLRFGLAGGPVSG